MPEYGSTLHGMTPGPGVRFPRSTHPYIPTHEGWLYLAGIKDLCSKEIVGFCLSPRMDVSLVLNALHKAFQTHRPAPVLMLHVNQHRNLTRHVHPKMTHLEVTAKRYNDLTLKEIVIFVNQFRWVKFACTLIAQAGQFRMPPNNKLTIGADDGGTYEIRVFNSAVDGVGLRVQYEKNNIIDGRRTSHGHFDSLSEALEFVGGYCNSTEQRNNAETLPITAAGRETEQESARVRMR